ncbi:MAG: hypothetical protein JWN69_1776 [Alphaproteobacteria bacterium]|nr:hypothetical protein [Alphaproteobacteria bacterium]
MSRQDLIDRFSASLWEAECGCTRIAPLSDSAPDLGEEEAYQVAARTFARRGRRQIGFKLGYTSAAMRQQMNIANPNYGRLAEDQLVPEDSGKVDSENLVHPLVEPEIALIVGRDLAGPGHTRASVFGYVDAAMASIEVVDTRYVSYKFKAVDNISDNSSSARAVLGAPKSFKSLDDLRLCGALLRSNGQVLDHGIGANALGDPLLSLAWLANFLGERGDHIPAGSIILTGGLTRAYPANAGQTIVAEFSQLGTIMAAF